MADPQEAPQPRRSSWWTWNVGKLAGIPIRVHLTLVLLLLWIAVAYALSGANWSMTALGVFLVMAIFATIVIHELGHALVARKFGYKTRDILLLPIGGIASLERIPEKPSQELAVAVVGPAINLAIAGILYLGISATHGSLRLGHATSIGGAFVIQLMWINVALALFNLIPAFPMDGGRALRALLSMKLGPQRATDVAAACGKVFAVLFGFIGLFYNPFLVLIAFVVWMGANQERALVHLKTALAGVPVSAAMLKRVDAVAPEQPLEDAAQLLTAGGLDEVPVFDHGQALGVITRSDLSRALSHARPGATIADAPRHDVLTVAPSEPLDQVLDRLRQSPGAVALVVDHGHPVGLLTAEHLARYAALHEAHA
jgi:Zn-dependent protease/CBS domain-containing protein